MTTGRLGSAKLMPMADPSGIDFTCPRCQVAVTEPFYGPCRDCRADLRETQGGVAKDVVAERFAPAMHVTPNAVAAARGD